MFPYNFPTNDKEPPTVCPVDEKVLEDYFKLCLDNGTKPVVITMPVHSALKKNYDADVLKLFRNTINKVIKKTGWRAKFIDLLDIAISDKRFQDKSHLTSEGKAIVTALLSERLFFGDIISPQEILNANKDFFNILSKYFSHEGFYWSDDRPLFHYIFCKMACEDFNRLSKTMSKETCMDLMVQVFFELTYSYLASLAEMLSKDDYNELTNRIFKMTVENIRHKDKIKVGFYFEYSSHWCGDDLYNLLAQDEHFEPTIFVPTYISNELSRHEFLNDLKKFKARGLNVFEITNPSLQLPKQDVIFRFYPYPTWLPHDLCLANLKVKEALAIVEELPQGRKLDTAKFKLLTGGDKIPIRRLHEEYTMIDPTHKIVISGNYRPELTDARDPGLIRRIQGVDFLQHFTDSNRDPHLKKKLLAADALSGLLTLLVDAAKAWYQYGLLFSKAMETSTRNYFAQNDFLSEFISEFCEHGEGRFIEINAFVKRLKEEYPAETRTISDRNLKDMIKRLQGREGITYKRHPQSRRFGLDGIGFRGGTVQQSLVHSPSGEFSEP